jgi:hypothetical protein
MKRKSRATPTARTEDWTEPMDLSVVGTVYVYDIQIIFISIQMDLI